MHPMRDLFIYDFLLLFLTVEGEMHYPIVFAQMSSVKYVLCISQLSFLLDLCIKRISNMKND